MSLVDRVAQHFGGTVANGTDIVCWDISLSCNDENCMCCNFLFDCTREQLRKETALYTLHYFLSSRGIAADTFTVTMRNDGVTFHCE